MEGQKLLKQNTQAKLKKIEMKFMYKENAPLLPKPAAQPHHKQKSKFREKYEVQVE